MNAACRAFFIKGWERSVDWNSRLARKRRMDKAVERWGRAYYTDLMLRAREGAK